VAEFGLKGLSAEWDKRIDGKVRAALTRQYNKTHQEVTKMKKSAAERNDDLAGSDYEEEEEDDGLVKGEPPWNFARSGYQSLAGPFSFDSLLCAVWVDSRGVICAVICVTDAVKSQAKPKAKRKSGGKGGGSKKRK
jgi:hypothetical protein